MPVTKKFTGAKSSAGKSRKKITLSTKGNSSVNRPDQESAGIKPFAEELARQMRRHRDTHITLLQAVAKPGENHSPMIFAYWSRGEKAPRWPISFQLLRRVERRYGLPTDHFKGILRPQSARWDAIKSVTANQQNIMRWHLPEDFDSRSRGDQEKILLWIHRNVLTGASDYGKFIQANVKTRYTIRFPQVGDFPPTRKLSVRFKLNGGIDAETIKRADFISDVAPSRLVEELDNLMTFKRATIAPGGLGRYSGWSAETAAQRLGTYGRFFGALIASPRSEIRGLGASKSQLTFALMIFPKVWDWWLSWREHRRGFFTKYETNTLVDVMSLVRSDTGWLRQHPQLASHLTVVTGLVSRKDIAAARENWDDVCDKAFNHLRNRKRELCRISRLHRDPFEPILTVLKSDSPLGEYRKIVQEILRRMPNDKYQPTEAAEAMRAYLILRFGMHLGLRQRNMRELLLCPRGSQSIGNLLLQKRRCGELRWSDADNGWEVFIPAIAFKNWDSEFFRKGAFRQLLPNLEGLYRFIEVYIEKHRSILLGGRVDPGTFFVRTMKSDKKPGTLDSMGFYFAWRTAIQRYGIYNPFTRRGAIKGLLPHGPHAVRDVLATHVIKHTASYELAGFAVHDTADVVKKHYCRFLPEEKTALAAKILNKVWQGR